MVKKSGSEGDASKGGPSLNDDDRAIIESAKRGLEYGVELRAWWEDVDRRNAYTDKYEETIVFRRPEDKSFGFFETAQLSGGSTKIIGNVQEMLYDRPKGGTTPEQIRKQIKAFVLKYFMRVSDYREPQQAPEPGAAELPEPLRFLGPATHDEIKTKGFGYLQRYYKQSKDGLEGKFSEQEDEAIVDVSELESKYDWIVLRNPIQDFGFDFALGSRGPQLKLKVPAANSLILSKETVTIQDQPEPGVLGRYGVGYAFVRDPGKPGLFAYGPGQLEPALQLLVWEVLDTGEVHVRMTFVSSAPEGLINVSLNPLEWGFAAADLLTGGAAKGFLSPFKAIVDRLPLSGVTVNPLFPAIRALNFITLDTAAKYLRISEREVNKKLLFIHFMQHYNAVIGSLQTWRQFPSWTDARKLPKWVKEGTST